MKNILAFLCCSHALLMQAQYTITAASKPDIGDSFNYAYADTANVVFGTAGPNQVWNYSNLSLTSPQAFYANTYVAASSTPNYSYFPGSYMALFNAPALAVYYDHDPANLGFVRSDYSDGFPSSGVQDIAEYDNPEIIYHYPMYYGSSFSDSLSGQHYTPLPQYNTSPENMYLKGLNTYTVNGYGTLMLPYNVVINNVLKVRSLLTKMTTYGCQYRRDSLLTEDYFSANSKFPILTIYSEYIWDSGCISANFTYAKGVLIDYPTITGIHEAVKDQPGFGMYPNPSAGEMLYISPAGPVTHERLDVTICSLLGETLKSAERSPGSEGPFSISLKGLSPGIYMVSVEAGGRKSTKKLVIE